MDVTTSPDGTSPPGHHRGHGAVDDLNEEDDDDAAGEPRQGGDLSGEGRRGGERHGEGFFFVQLTSLLKSIGEIAASQGRKTHGSCRGRMMA